MKTTYRTLIVASAGLMSALLLGFQANAECGRYQPRVAPSSWQQEIAPGQLLKAAYAIGGREDAETRSAEPTMVGLWKEHWISKGSEGIPDGTEVDTQYSQWHADGTEMGVSGLRPPMTGDVCVGVWEKVGPRTYKLNHIGISYDSTGLNLVGEAIIRQHLTLSEKGNGISGTFTIDQYDESGNLLAHVQGTLYGTRITVNTGFDKVE
jgi:hypothetical protein